jgi:hypothetical protein
MVDSHFQWSEEIPRLELLMQGAPGAWSGTKRPRLSQARYRTVKAPWWWDSGAFLPWFGWPYGDSQAQPNTAWDAAKNAKLRAERGIAFEDVVFHIERGDLLDTLTHPSPERYGGQRIFVVRREDCVYLVPFPPSPASFRGGLRRGLAVALRAEADVEDEHTVFLKTIIPSRKATKHYFGEESDDEARCR